MKVLSLFDGMSCGRIALERAGIQVTSYFASEIDKYAVQVSKKNYPDIIHIGNICNIKYENGTLSTPNGEFKTEIDLVIGGSPCQGFSLSGKMLNFNDPRSSLFFEYLRILNEVRECNPKVKFLLENVKMKVEIKDEISRLMGVVPSFINSSLVSAQNRPRLYWTNISHTTPQDKNICLKDILLDEVDDKYYIKSGRLKWLQKFGEVKEKDGYVAFNPNKGKCLTVRGEPSWNTTYILQWPRGYNPGGLKGKDGKSPSMTTSSWPANNLLLKEGMVRKLTPIECERLQTVPDNYTLSVSDTQRYKMLGNGWTIDVITHIFNGLK